MLKNKCAIITGGSQGIGAGIGQAFSENGANIVLVARSSTKLEEISNEIKMMGDHQIHTISLDLREANAAKAVVEETIEVFGQIDIVVNNAGATKRGDFFDLKDDDFVDGFELKFFSTVRMTRAAWPYLMEKKGNIINIIGAGARYGSPDFTIGGSVNSACHNFTKAMAERGRFDSVRVNAINPGLIKTPRLENNIKRIQNELGISNHEAMNKIQDSFQQMRIGNPKDIAALAVFIASAAGDLLHG